MSTPHILFDHQRLVHALCIESICFEYILRIFVYIYISDLFYSVIIEFRLKYNEPQWLHNQNENINTIVQLPNFSHRKKRRKIKRREKIQIIGKLLHGQPLNHWAHGYILNWKFTTHQSSANRIPIEITVNCCKFNTLFFLNTNSSINTVPVIC